MQARAGAARRAAPTRRSRRSSPQRLAGAVLLGTVVVPEGLTDPEDVPEAPMPVEPMPVLLVLLPGVVVVVALALGVVVVVVVLDVGPVRVVAVDWQPASTVNRAMPRTVRGAFMALMDFRGEVLRTG